MRSWRTAVRIAPGPPREKPLGARAGEARPVGGVGQTGQVRALARRLGYQRWFIRLGRLLVPADRMVGRLTRGRVVALGLGPSLLLTTTGRRSGKPRVSPLLYARDGDAFVVIGSNWGQANHPAWTGNLLADPRATVELHGRAIPVHATLVGGAERARMRDLLLAIWPAYEAYEHRSGRHIRIFRLQPSRLAD